MAIPYDSPEISDRIVAFESHTLKRRPVAKADLIREFREINNPRAVRIVETLPATANGVLDATEMDRLLVTVHCEMQRMSEEFQHGRRMAQILNPLLESIRTDAPTHRLRVVDIGCGTGFVLRWLAAHRAVPDDVELIGADYNPALVAEAQRLALAEKLSCQFKVANAFQLDEGASIYISTGILHHFRGRELIDLFAQHSRPETRAFLHFDFHQSWMAPFGSWLFHAARMRQPLAKHDGVLSAIRAYTSEELLAAAREGAPEFMSAVYGTRLWRLPFPRAFHSLVGVLPAYHAAFIENMGGKVAALGVIQ
jgi:2-polyprenyl-3-methyl-5-hydroxy-6-metoxy-1,4-benzoquinol methylase